MIERCLDDFRRRGDHAGFAMACGTSARDAKRLLHAEPAELLKIVIQRDCAVDGPAFAATVVFTGCGVRLTFCFTLSLWIGGKTPRFVR